MDAPLPAHELGVILLSSSFAVALVLGAIAGKLGGLLIGAGAGMLAVAGLSLAAAWITWQAGPQPDRGVVRVEGRVAADAPPQPGASDWNQTAASDAVIRFTDASGRAREITAPVPPHSQAAGSPILLDYPEGAPDRVRVADLATHTLLLNVFLLFGVLPLAMASVMFTSAWENRAGATGPAPRPAAVAAGCRYARIAANLGLLYGFYVTASRDGLESIMAGFPLIGATAGAHALICAVAGVRASAVLIYLVVAAGFVGFGLFARSAGAT
jgi:hypothetical protein